VTDRKTTLARLGGRTAAGVAGLAATAAVLAAVAGVPFSTAQAKPASRVVTPVPATATAACPGALLTLSSDASSSAVSATGTPSVVSGGSATPGSAALGTPDLTGGGNAPTGLQLPARDGGEPLLAAAQSLAVSTPELRGLAVASCGQPDYDQWLVGGATSLGQTTFVLLSNPGDVAATVNLAVYFEQGEAAGAGGQGIVVRPHTQRAIALSGLAPNASATVVHVSSTGGTVSAELQQSAISGVTPQGVDWVGPAAAPAKNLVIPGVTVAAPAAGASDADDDALPALRVMPVGSQDAKLTIGVRPETGSRGGEATTVTVSHGVVSEVPLDKVGKGTYTVTIASSTPVVAAVRSTTTDAKKGTDFAWYAAARPLRGGSAVAVASGTGARLHLVNTSSAAVSVKLAGPGGGTVQVPAGASISRAASPGVLTTADAHGLVMSVGYSAAGQLGSYLAYPTGASASALTVYKR